MPRSAVVACPPRATPADRHRVGALANAASRPGDLLYGQTGRRRPRRQSPLSPRGSATPLLDQDQIAAMMTTTTNGLPLLDQFGTGEKKGRPTGGFRAIGRS
jgi:hypothetical protein